MARGPLLIVWWSMTGGTEQLAGAARDAAVRDAAEAGADGGELEVLLLRADRAQPGQVLEASGYLFCTPENLGSMSGMPRISSTAAITRRSTGSTAAPTRASSARARTARAQRVRSTASRLDGGCGGCPSR
jgi:hypothetical protein